MKMLLTDFDLKEYTYSYVYYTNSHVFIAWSHFPGKKVKIWYLSGSLSVGTAGSELKPRNLLSWEKHAT